MATTKLRGNEIQLIGNEVNVGDIAPIVSVAGQDLKDIQIGGEKGCVQVIVTVPSLDTPICAAETRKFNEDAANMENVEIVVVSLDLPFAMERFCTTEGIENLIVGSDFRNKDLANAYGVLIDEGPLKGITCRSIFVINASGKIVYKDICEEITKEPNYEPVMAAIKDASGTSCCGTCH